VREFDHALGSDQGIKSIFVTWFGCGMDYVDGLIIVVLVAALFCSIWLLRR
jgi:hypothetical protein